MANSTNVNPRVKRHTHNQNDVRDLSTNLGIIQDEIDNFDAWKADYYTKTQINEIEETINDNIDDLTDDVTRVYSYMNYDILFLKIKMDGTGGSVCHPFITQMTVVSFIVLTGTLQGYLTIYANDCNLTIESTESEDLVLLLKLVKPKNSYNAGCNCSPDPTDCEELTDQDEYCECMQEKDPNYQCFVPCDESDPDYCQCLCGTDEDCLKNCASGGETGGSGGGGSSGGGRKFINIDLGEELDEIVEDDCLTFTPVNNGVKYDRRGFLTGVDYNSGGSYVFNPECYEMVQYKGQCQTVLGGGVLYYGYRDDVRAIRIPSIEYADEHGMGASTEFTVTMYNTGVFQVTYKRSVNVDYNYEVTVFDSGTIDTEGFMVAGVYGLGRINTIYLQKVRQEPTPPSEWDCVDVFNNTLYDNIRVGAVPVEPYGWHNVSASVVTIAMDEGDKKGIYRSSEIVDGEDSYVGIIDPSAVVYGGTISRIDQPLRMEFTIDASNEVVIGEVQYGRLEIGGNTYNFESKSDNFDKGFNIVLDNETGKATIGETGCFGWRHYETPEGWVYEPIMEIDIPHFIKSQVDLVFLSDHTILTGLTVCKPSNPDPHEIIEVLYESENGSIIHNKTNKYIGLYYNGDDPTVESSMIISDRNYGATEYVGESGTASNAYGDTYMWGATTPCREGVVSTWADEDWNETQTIAPSGRHIPTSTEWEKLKNIYRAIRTGGTEYFYNEAAYIRGDCLFPGDHYYIKYDGTTSSIAYGFAYILAGPNSSWGGGGNTPLQRDNYVGPFVDINPYQYGSIDINGNRIHSVSEGFIRFFKDS